MSVCEKCWRDAALRVATLGGSQVEHYNALLEEREYNPCDEPDDEGGEA